MKPTKTKAELRAEIEAQMSAYLEQGGQVDQHPPGASGRALGEALPPVCFDRKPETARTMVQDVVNAIEQRRKPAKIPASKNRRPRKILLKDDFGEPIRWIWKDE